MTFVWIPLLSILTLAVIWSSPSWYSPLSGAWRMFVAQHIPPVCHGLLQHARPDTTDYAQSVTFRRQHSSAFRISYFLIFLVTAVSLTYSMYVGIEDIWDTLDQADLGLLSHLLFRTIAVPFCFLVGAQCIRIYITLEIWEDPHTPEHKDYVRPLPRSQRIPEQIIRGVLVALVSLKCLDYEESLLSPYEFLCMLYTVLLWWDVFMVRVVGRQWHDTFWKTSVAGYVLSLCLYWMLNYAGCSATPWKIVMPLGLVAGACYAMLLWSIMRRQRQLPAPTPTGVSEYLRSLWDTATARYIEYLRKMLGTVTAPYYGE